MLLWDSRGKFGVTYGFLGQVDLAPVPGAQTDLAAADSRLHTGLEPGRAVVHIDDADGYGCRGGVGVHIGWRRTAGVLRVCHNGHNIHTAVEA